MIGKAKLRFAKISPAKLRQVTPLIRRKKVNEALSILQFVNKKGAVILRKVLNSAVANTLQKESDIDEDSLFIKEVKVDDGSRWRRVRFNARGGASLLRKRTSHVTVVVEGVALSKEDKKKNITKDKTKKEHK